MNILERFHKATHLAEFYASRDDARSQLLARRYLARARFLARRLAVAHA